MCSSLQRHKCSSPSEIRLSSSITRAWFTMRHVYHLQFYVKFEIIQILTLCYGLRHYGVTEDTYMYIGCETLYVMLSTLQGIPCYVHTGSVANTFIPSTSLLAPALLPLPLPLLLLPSSLPLSFTHSLKKRLL